MHHLVFKLRTKTMNPENKPKKKMTTSCEIFALRLHVKRKTNMKKGGNSKKKKTYMEHAYGRSTLLDTHARTTSSFT